MRLVTLADVRRAATAVDQMALRTPLLPAAWAGSLWLKPENLQPIGSFKIRGASAAIARLPVGTPGVVTHSSGNHGRAVGHVAARRGVECVVVVPETAPPNKVAAIEDTGASVRIVPAGDRESAAEEIAARRGFVLVSPFDHRDVIAGQGTVGIEILEQLADVDTVVVPVGGGGLVSGVGAAVKALSPTTRVVGVEPELAADAAESLRTGRIAVWSTADRYRTVADGVRTGLSPLTFAHIDAHCDDIVTVTEDEIKDAVAVLARRSRIVAETSGALGTAAFLRHGAEWGRTVAVVSGGNIEPSALAELVTRDRTASGPRPSPDEVAAG